MFYNIEETKTSKKYQVPELFANFTSDTLYAKKSVKKQIFIILLKECLTEKRLKTNMLT